jgi:hypothetical protein
VKSFFLALSYFGMLAALLWAMGLHHHVTADIAALILAMSAVVSLIVFVDETRQQRRKWRDHPNRRRGILKEWNE